MKLLSCIAIISLLISVCHADEIHCYSGQQTIYKGFGDEIMYGDGYIFFIEPRTGKDVYIYGDCIVKYKEITNSRMNYKDE